MYSFPMYAFCKLYERTESPGAFAWFVASLKIFPISVGTLASVPTEIGNILRDATNEAKAPGDSVRSYNLQKAYIGNEYIQGALFTGKTSTGEKIDGIYLYGKS